ncbi:MAG: hypothetical protein ALAOOOJD_04522 [bacterium]|nr:hypothetical protein [bacterium]
MAELKYYLGCPQWSNKKWVGALFTGDARPTDFLKQYASVFNTVEGNTTFYALPQSTTVKRWREETPAHFRFCFKFPKRLSHQLRLQHVEKETNTFLKLLMPLGERLGPFFLQLPSTFDFAALPVLEKFLQTLPAEFTYAVEARHPDFFNAMAAEEKFNDLLRAQSVGRVVFDTRGLHAAQVPDDDFYTLEAKRRKPKVPVRFMATNQYPFVRFVGHPVIENNEFNLLQWASAVEKWLAAGKKPYIFMHTPDDADAPRLARFFHALVDRLAPEAGPLPLWPAEKEQTPETQLQLF